MRATLINPTALAERIDGWRNYARTDVNSERFSVASSDLDGKAIFRFKAVSPSSGIGVCAPKGTRIAPNA